MFLCLTNLSAHLCDMLAERWRWPELWQQVEGGGADGMNAAAVEHWQIFLTGQRQFLDNQYEIQIY